MCCTGQCFDMVCTMRTSKSGKPWKIYTVKNALDEIYIGSRLHSNPRQTAANQSSGILPGARRQVNVSLRYSF